MDLVGQTVEKPQGLYGKYSPKGESELDFLYKITQIIKINIFFR